MQVSLQEKINSIALRAMVLVAAVALIGIGIYWSYHQDLVRTKTANGLLKNIDSQANELALSLLLVEQNAALSLIMSDITAKEDLFRAEVLTPDRVGDKLNSCRSVDDYFICPGSQDNQLALAYPITIADSDFGYLVKEKKFSTSFSATTMISFFLFVFGLLILITLVLIVFFNRLTAKEIPNSIDQLINNIDQWLGGKTSSISHNSQFSDFHILADKLSQVIIKHDKQKNQATIGKLSSGILHDIKNDIQSVLAAFHLAEEQSENEVKSKKRQDNLLNVLAKKLPSLVNTVETTLDVNRDILLKKRVSDVSLTLQKSLSDLRDRLSDEKISVHVAKPKMLLEVSHDAGQMTRVFSNLLENSIDALANAPREDRQINISYHVDVDSLQIFLEDHGEGLKLKKNELFEAFKTSKTHGTGLGLFNAQKIIGAHGGRIEAVVPKALKGACFKLTFPWEGQHGAT